MADNVGYTPGYGAQIAADEIAGVKYQRIKTTFGDEGIAIDVSTTNPMPVLDYNAPMQSFTYTGSGVIPVNTDLITIDCTQYRSISVQCTSMGTTGQVSAQWSNDGIIWVTAATNMGAMGVQTNVGIATALVVARYFRLRLTTATTAGTTTYAVFASQQLITPNGMASTVTSLNATTNLIGDVGTQYRTGSGGGASGFHVVSAATNNAALILTNTRRLLGWYFSNTSAVWQYVKFFNKATLPIPGTDVPVRTVGIPPGSFVEYHMEGGNSFNLGLGIAVVTGFADLDNTPTTVGAVIGDVMYS